MQEIMDIVESALMLKGHEVVDSTEDTLTVVCADKKGVRISFTAVKSPGATCKMNVVNRGGTHAPECTNCGRRFDAGGYRDMCQITMGRYDFCPSCGARYVGAQVEGVDFYKCSPSTQDWIQSGLK